MMNEIFVLCHLAIVFLIPIHDVLGENHRHVELNQTIVSVSPTDAEQKILL